MCCAIRKEWFWSLCRINRFARRFLRRFAESPLLCSYLSLMLCGKSMLCCGCCRKSMLSRKEHLQVPTLTSLFTNKERDSTKRLIGGSVPRSTEFVIRTTCLHTKGTATTIGKPSLVHYYEMQILLYLYTLVHWGSFRKLPLGQSPSRTCTTCPLNCHDRPFSARSFTARSLLTHQQQRP